MNALRLLFLLLGGSVLILAADALHKTLSFQHKAISTSGTVIEARMTSRGDSVRYSAVISAFRADGTSFKFVASSGRKRQHFQPGEHVKVLYLAGEAPLAVLDTPARNWGSAVILAVIGSPLFLIGAFYCLRGARERHRRWRLKKYGVLLNVCFLKVVRDQSIRKSGVHPYVILCRWSDQGTGAVRIFSSEHVWFDPVRFIGPGTIRVWVQIGRAHV